MRKYEIPSEVQWTPSLGATVLLLPGIDKRYYLNPTASSVWEDLSAGKTVEEIELRFAQEYKISGERIKADIQTLLTKLQELGLIVVSGPSPRSRIAR